MADEYESNYDRTVKAMKRERNYTPDALWQIALSLARIADLMTPLKVDFDDGVYDVEKVKEMFKSGSIWSDADLK